jgi:hypothetical protein
MDLGFLLLDIRLLFFTAIIVFFIYIIFISLFNRAIISWADPLYFNLIMLSFYTAGLIGFFIMFKPSPKYYIILVLILLYFIVGSIASRNCAFNTSGLAISKKNQLIFCWVLLLIFISSLVVNYLFGYMPLLEGTGTRYLVGRNSRLLYWLETSCYGYPIILFGLTDHKIVKKHCIILIAILATIGLLTAAKGFIFYMFFMLIYYNLFLYLKERNSNNPAFKEEYRLKRMKNLKLVIISLVCLIALAPFYLVLIKSAGTVKETFPNFIFRLFFGFDQLIYISNLDIGLVDKGVSMLSIYTSSFFKIFNYTFIYNSIPELLFHEMFGIFGASFEHMMPNSNLIMEVIFTNGLYLGTLLLIVFSFLNFTVRRRILYKNKLKLIDIVIFNYFFMFPLWWFLSGQDFIVNFTVGLFVYLVVNFYLNIKSANGLRKLTYKFY